MASSQIPTKWIILAVALVVVVVGAAGVLVGTRLSTDEGTSEVAPTTESTTTTVPPSPTSRPDDPTTPPTEPDDIDVEKVSVSVGGIPREYTVISPIDPGASASVPVVLALHGLGVNANAMSRGADWRGAVSRDGFIAVFPQGVMDSWNSGPCCPPASLVGVNDTAFLDKVVADMVARPDVDPDRVYMTGFSNGGIMVYGFACARPGVLAGIAPIAGSNLTGCFPGEPLSLLHQHSDPDFLVPFDGTPTIGQLLSSADFPSVPDSVAAWAAEDGCAPDPVTSVDADDVERFVWSDCAAGTSVELVRVPDRGHVWPRKGEFDPLEEILRFFDLS